MKPLLAALAATLAAAPDAGTADLSGADSGPMAARYGCIDAPEAVQLDGGWLLMPPERAERVACLLMGCQTELAGQSSTLSGAAPIVLATGLGLGVGFAVGFAVGAHKK